MSLQDFSWENLLASPLTLACLVFCLLVLAAGLAWAVLSPRLFRLVFKNLRRNLLRTGLTAVAIMVLVLTVTAIATVLYGLERFTQEKSKDLKLIIMDRYQVPSQLPGTYARYLDPTSPSCILNPKDVGPNDFMTWSFYGGTMDPEKRTLEHLVFFFVTNPKSIIPMMDDLDELDPVLVAKLEKTINGCLLGPERLRRMNKVVGNRFKLTSLNYKDVDLDFEIVGALPEGRYAIMGIMRADYFNNKLDEYARKNKAPHPLDQKRLNLIWLRVPDRATFDRVAAQVKSSSYLQNPPVKCEMASSAIGAFLEPFRTLLFGMKVLVLVLLVVMSLVLANSISISVRERRTEMAVLKVLGFRPGQVAALVVGESLLVGGLSGLLAAAGTYFYFNTAYGGLPFQIGFTPVFAIPVESLVWGLTMGLSTSLLGCFLPAWSARSVKVSEVFAKVA
jgi:putative ABC transport system permease protein